MPTPTERVLTWVAKFRDQASDKIDVFKSKTEQAWKAASRAHLTAASVTEGATKKMSKGLRLAEASIATLGPTAAKTGAKTSLAVGKMLVAMHKTTAATKTLGLTSKDIGLVAAELVRTKLRAAELQTGLSGLAGAAPEEFGKVAKSMTLMLGKDMPKRMKLIFAAAAHDGGVEAIKAFHKAITGAKIDHDKLVELMRLPPEAQAKFLTNLLDPSMIAAGKKSVGEVVKSLSDPIVTGLGVALRFVGKVMKGTEEDASRLAKTFDKMGEAIDRIPGVDKVKSLSRTMGSFFTDFGRRVGRVGKIVAGIVTLPLRPLLGRRGREVPVGVAVGKTSKAIDKTSKGLGGFAKSLGSIFAIVGPMRLLIEALAPVAAALKNALLPLLKPLTDLLLQIVAALRPVIDALMPVIKGLFDRLVPVLMPIVDVLGKVLVDAIQMLSPILMMLVDAVTPLIEPLMEIVGVVLPPLVQMFGALLKVALLPLIPILKILAPAFKLLALILKPIGWIIEQIAKGIEWMADKLFSFFSFKWLTDLLPGFVKRWLGIDGEGEAPPTPTPGVSLPVTALPPLGPVGRPIPTLPLLEPTGRPIPALPERLEVGRPVGAASELLVEQRARIIARAPAAAQVEEDRGVPQWAERLTMMNPVFMMWKLGSMLLGGKRKDRKNTEDVVDAVDRVRSAVDSAAIQSKIDAEDFLTIDRVTRSRSRFTEESFV